MPSVLSKVAAADACPVRKCLLALWWRVWVLARFKLGLELLCNKYLLPTHYLGRYFTYLLQWKGRMLLSSTREQHHGALSRSNIDPRRPGMDRNWSFLLAHDAPSPTIEPRPTLT